MRVASLILLLFASPVFAQQVDPALVNAWAKYNAIKAAERRPPNPELAKTQLAKAKLIKGNRLWNWYDDEGDRHPIFGGFHHEEFPHGNRIVVIDEPNFTRHRVELERLSVKDQRFLVNLLEFRPWWEDGRWERTWVVDPKTVVKVELGGSP